MTKAIHYEPDFLAGLTARKKLVVPVLATDPTVPQDGWVWVNTTDHVLRYREAGVTISLSANLDAEQVQDIVGAMLVSGNNIDLAYNDATGQITVDVEGLTSADISDFATAVRALITAGTNTATAAVTIAGGAVTVDVLDSPTVGTRTPGFLLSVDNHTDGTTNRLFTATLRTKLVGIEDGATKNATDAALRDRGTHTGSQLAETISDFATAVQSVPNLDADTLNGSTSAQLQSAVTAAIVDSAPGTLDTLNEIAAALGDDPNFATTITTTLSQRARFFSAPVPATAFGAGVADAVITHNLGTTKVLVQVFNVVSGFEEEFQIARAANTVTIRSEAGAIPDATYEVNIVTAA